MTPFGGNTILFNFTQKLLVSEPWRTFWDDKVPLKEPQPGFVCCFQNYRDTMTLSDVASQPGRSQDTVKNDWHKSSLLKRICFHWSNIGRAGAPLAIPPPEPLLLIGICIKRNCITSQHSTDNQMLKARDVYLWKYFSNQRSWGGISFNLILCSRQIIGFIR